MDQKSEVYLSMFELADSAVAGIEHIHRRTMQGFFEDTAELFTDVADSFHHLNRALEAYRPDSGQCELDRITAEVVEGMKMLLAAYEGDRDLRPMVVLQFSLLPGFKKWRDALRETLGGEAASFLN